MFYGELEGVKVVYSMCLDSWDVKPSLKDDDASSKPSTVTTGWGNLPQFSADTIPLLASLRFRLPARILG